MNRTPLPVLAGAALLAAGLAAQSQPVPAYANDVDGHQSVGMPFGIPGFRTQILIDPAAIAPNGAILTGIRFRADRPSGVQNAVSVPNVTVSVSDTTVTAGNLNAVFALNVTGTPTVVFQGTVNLPAQTGGLAGPLAWDIVIPFSQQYVYTTTSGSLLIDIVGNNPVGGFPQFYLDAVQPGGAVTPFGVAGDNPTFDSLQVIASTGGALEPRLIEPGGTIQYTSTLFFTQPPGFLILGTVPLPGIDLSIIGAPTNFLYVDPIVLSTHSWTQSFIGWYSTFQLTIPLNQQLVGATLYAQSAILEPTANPFGLVLSSALETRIGDGQLAVQIQQCDANDPAATQGTLLDFGFGLPELGATPVLLEGTFF